MGKIKGWKKIIDNEWFRTGGGFNYYVTFYRNEYDPRKQIEIWKSDEYIESKGLPKDRDIDPTGEGVLLNVGTRDENIDEEFDPIEGGGYYYNNVFETLKEAKRKAREFMKKYPKGGWRK